MRIELNVGLTVEGGNNSTVARAARLNGLAAALNTLAPGYQLERKTATHGGADGNTPTIEDTAIVALNVASIHPGAREPLAIHLFAISQALGQDCIAMYLPAFGIGKLIGPRAGNWGDFDLKFFTRATPARVEANRTFERIAA